MKPLIFNSTPLIYITKIGLSKILETLEGEKYTTPLVKKEVVDKGKDKGVPDAFILEKLFENNIFTVISPKNQQFLIMLLKTRGLHITDAEVLTVTKDYNGIAILDDDIARKVAKIYVISHTGTPYLLIQAVNEKIITKDRAKQAIQEMISAGWRCSIELYNKLIAIIENL